MKYLNDYYDFRIDLKEDSNKDGLYLDFISIKAKKIPYIIFGAVQFALTLILANKIDLSATIQFCLLLLNIIQVSNSCGIVMLNKAISTMNIDSLSKILQGQEVYVSADNLIKAVHVKEEKQNDNDGTYKEDSYMFKDEEEQIKVLKEIRTILIDGSMTKELYLLDEDEIDMNDVDVKKIKKFVK